MGAPPVAKLGWVENTKPPDRQDLKLGNSNFAEVGFCRSYLSRGHCFNPAPKCQETRNLTPQLRISGLGGCRRSRIRCLTEEAYQPFDILRCRREEELFADELHTAQAKPSHSDLILQLREQRFHLLAGSLRDLKRRRLG